MSSRRLTVWQSVVLALLSTNNTDSGLPRPSLLDVLPDDNMPGVRWIITSKASQHVPAVCFGLLIRTEAVWGGGLSALHA